MFEPKKYNGNTPRSDKSTLTKSLANAIWTCEVGECVEFSIRNRSTAGIIAIAFNTAGKEYRVLTMNKHGCNAILRTK